ACVWLFLVWFLGARSLLRLQMLRGSTLLMVVLAAFGGVCGELELWVAGFMLGTTDTSFSVLALCHPLDEVCLVCEKIQRQALV
ncbi:helix-turn-helix-type transcriptional regulator, partial [Pseudomonas sp. RTB2]|nr:helix-turn-helix-type transcriptional regulator [Pseudomonas sp. RTB2]